MRILYIMVAFLLPYSLFAEEKSNSNFLYSYYKPNQKKFISKVKNNYVSNKRLQKAYLNFETEPVDALLYALAMDYGYADASKTTLEAYRLAAFSIDGAFGFISMLEYADFLVRTKRYDYLEEININMCGRDTYQCSYYKLVGKYLSSHNFSKEECDKAMRFLPMRKMTIKICE